MSPCGCLRLPRPCSLQAIRSWRGLPCAFERPTQACRGTCRGLRRGCGLILKSPTRRATPATSAWQSRLSINCLPGPRAATRTSAAVPPSAPLAIREALFRGSADMTYPYKAEDTTPGEVDRHGSQGSEGLLRGDGTEAGLEWSRGCLERWDPCFKR